MRLIDKKEEELEALKKETIEWSKEKPKFIMTLHNMGKLENYAFLTAFLYGVCYTLEQESLSIKEFEDFQSDFANKYANMIENSKKNSLEPVILTLDDIRYIYLLYCDVVYDPNEKKILEFLEKTYGKPLDQREFELTQAKEIEKVIELKTAINEMSREEVLECLVDYECKGIEKLEKEIADIEERIVSIKDIYATTVFDYEDDSNYISLYNKQRELKNKVASARLAVMAKKDEASTLSLEELRKQLIDSIKGIGYADEFVTFLSRRKLDVYGLSDLYKGDSPAYIEGYNAEVNDFFRKVRLFEKAETIKVSLDELSASEIIQLLIEEIGSSSKIIDDLAEKKEHVDLEREDLRTTQLYKDSNRMSEDFLIYQLDYERKWYHFGAEQDDEKVSEKADKKFTRKYGISHQEFLDRYNSIVEQLTGLDEDSRRLDNKITYNRNRIRKDVVLLVTEIKKIFPDFDLGETTVDSFVADCSDIIAVTDWFVNNDNNGNLARLILDEANDQARMNSDRRLTNAIYAYNCLPEELRAVDVYIEDVDNDEKIILARDYVKEVLDAETLAAREITVSNDVLKLVADDYDSLSSECVNEVKLFVKQDENK